MNNSVQTRRKQPPNQMSAEYKWQRVLHSDASIMVPPADKGTATMIMNKSDYLQKAVTLLNNIKSWTRLSADSLPIATNQISKLIRIQKRLHSNSI